MKIKLLFLLSFTAIVAQAQILSYDYYTFRQNNMFNVNPAYAGKGDNLNVLLNAQSQNKGVLYNNKNYSLGAFSKISEKQALGGKLISDSRGAFRLLKADVSYAYIAKFSEDATLTFGMSAGLLNNNFSITRVANYQMLDQSDPNLSQYNNTTQFTAGAGVLGQYKDLEISVSLPHILTTNQVLNNYINAAAFYAINVKEKFKLTPWVSYQNIPLTKNIFAGYLRTMYSDMVWLQIGYQSNKSLQTSVGVNIENIGLAYGFRFNNQSFSAVAYGSHELTMLYKIPDLGKKRVSNVANNSGLYHVILQLDKLLNAPVTEENKAEIRSELENIKLQLQKTELDNSTPEKAKEVEQQLIQIDEKLKLIEQKLLNE